PLFEIGRDSTDGFLKSKVWSRSAKENIHFKFPVWV
ncbi:hypothetical protein LEP1GSC170_2035, partial [Leptospira interrogans serovar Bataviae str. HAI135]